MNRMTRTLLATLILAGASVMAHAQSCEPQDTILTCWQRFMPAAPPTAEPSEVRHALNEIETGTDSGGGTASSLKNFLPLLGIAGLGGSGDSPGENGHVALDLNFLVPGLGDNGQLQAILNTEPKIYEPLATALKAFDPNTDPETLLGLETKDADDYAIAFTYGLSNGTKGRNLEEHRTRFDNLFRAAIASIEDTAGVDTLLEVTGALQASALDALTEDQQANFQDVAFSEIADVDARNELKGLFERLGAETATREMKVRENATALGMQDFAKLLSNQPQLHAALRREVRDSFIGANTTTAEFTYELGFVNLNSFNAEAGTACAEADKRDADLTLVKSCGTAIRDYVDRDDVRARLEHGDRLSFSLAYSKVDELTVALPNTAFLFQADGTRKVTASAAYGRLFGLRDGVADTRLDFEAKYEDVSDDATRNDRVIASVTVTKKVGNLSIPFSLSYSNRPEFVAVSDAKLGAHIGVIFNTFGDPK